MLVLVLLGAGLGYRALRDSSLFAVHSVVIEGANPTLRAQVEAAVHRSVGDRSLLAVSSSRLVRAIDDVPGVHVSTVDRDFPSTLRVRVWPEHPVAVAVSGHDRVIVSATGRVLATIGRRSRPPNLPRVGLPGRGVPAPGAQIANPKVLAQLAAVYAIPAHFGAAVSWVRIDPQHGLELQLRWPNLPIRLGPAVDLREKLRAAALVLRAYPTLAMRQQLRYVDVSAPARPAVLPVTPDQTTATLVTDTAGSTDTTGTSNATSSTDTANQSSSTDTTDSTTDTTTAPVTTSTSSSP